MFIILFAKGKNSRNYFKVAFNGSSMEIIIHVLLLLKIYKTKNFQV